MGIDMSKKVVIIHTSFISVDVLNGLFKEIVPDAEIRNIVDDTLLPEIMQNGGVTKAVRARYCAYARQAAEVIHADLIFNQCSSAGPAADYASEMIDVPILKVDQAMAEKAVELGRRIAVVATIGTTLNPSTALIQKVAKEKGSDTVIAPFLLEDAYEALFLHNDAALQNKILLDKLWEIKDDFDVVVLAQGSMVTLLDELTDYPLPLLTSPRLGVERAKELLAQM